LISPINSMLARSVRAMERFVKPVQIQVRQQGRDHPA